MSPHHPPKRRRLDDALSKPFKSPFKTPLASRTTNTPTAATLPDPDSKPDLPLESPSKTTSKSQEPSSPPQPPTISLPPSTTPSTHLHNLQTRHTALLTTLATSKSRLETSSQALKIETASQREAELSRLIVKWKAASRAAAEEVFAGARDRVNKMGGVKGLRERERAKREMAWGWEEEGQRVGSAGGGEDDDGEGDTDEEAGEGIGDREERLERESKDSMLAVEESEYDREIRRELEEQREEDLEGEANEGGYTMDMMLKTMNIDLDVIGYDKGLQRWVD